MSVEDEIAKKVPVKEIYQDLAQPAVREIGQALENTIKAARFVLAPIEYISAWRDRWERYLKRIADKVPPERLVEADPEVAGPIFLNLLYSKEGGLLAEMFVNLLARAVDKEHASEAHPAYGHIVGQLHPDEALILYFLKKRPFALVQSARFNPADATFTPRELISNEFPVSELTFPGNLGFYMDHLYHLSLAWVRQVGNQEIIYEGEPRVQTGVIIRNVVELMSFGWKFASTCVPDELPKAGTNSTSSADF